MMEFSPNLTVSLNKNKCVERLVVGFTRKGLWNQLFFKTDTYEGDRQPGSFCSSDQAIVMSFTLPDAHACGIKG